MKLDELVIAIAKSQIQPQIEIGTVGWASETSHFDKGDPNGAPGERHTLVRVTLFRGKDPTKPAKEGVAQGHEILAAISGGLFRIPKKGTLVYLIVPHGMESMPGAALIIATREDDPSTQFEQDRVVIDFGNDVHVVIRGASVTMKDPAHRFVSVGSPRGGGAPGVQVHLPDGTGAVWQDGAHGCFVRESSYLQMTPTMIECWQKTGQGAFMQMGNGVFHTYAPTNKVQGAGCYIGKAPVVANTAVVGLPAPGTQLASASVFISVV